jgi:hypothetical protein
VTLAIHLRWNDPAVTAPSFLSKPGKVIERHTDLPLALREGLAVLEGYQAGEFVLSVAHFSGDFVKPLTPLFAGKLSPFEEGGMCVLNGSGYFGVTDERHFTHGVTIGGVKDLPGL